jgi:nucleoside-diphosphate-sugar epimerase
MTNEALVTGACGFLGSKLTEHLAERDLRVVATDLEEADRSRYYTETDDAPHPEYDPTVVRDRSEVTFVPADLTAPDTLDRLFDGHDYDAVFHAASLFDYFADRETLEAVNVDGARNLAERAVDAGVGHFVHFSTAGVLGESGFDAPKDEEATCNPHNRYCESKMRQERTLRSLKRGRGLPLTIVRPAPIYGPGNRYGVYHIPLLLSKMGVAPVYRIYPRSKQLYFPSIHVEDLCDIALFLADRRDRVVGEVYNAVSDCIRQDELLSFLGEAVGVPRVRVPIPYRVYKLLCKYAVVHSERIERIARERDVRPKVDASMTRYLSHNMWYSNRKIRDLGFEFTYRDPRRGLWNYVTWCKERGLLA